MKSIFSAVYRTGPVLVCSVIATTAIAAPQSPRREPVVIRELPLPPTAASEEAGACKNKTGCIDPSDEGIGEGPSYTWDGRHVLLPIRFAGAPAPPDPDRKSVV